MVRRSPWQTWTPPLCSTACLAIHLGSAAPDLPDGWSVVKYVAMILTLLLNLILLPREAVPRLLLHLETEPTVPPEVKVGCLCWTLGGKILLSICFPYICNQDACLHCSYRFGLFYQTFTFLAPFPMVWLCSAPISETILAFRELEGCRCSRLCLSDWSIWLLFETVRSPGNLDPHSQAFDYKEEFWVNEFLRDWRLFWLWGSWIKVISPLNFLAKNANRVTFISTDNNELLWDQYQEQHRC